MSLYVKSLKTPAEDSFVKSALKGVGTTTFPLHLSARDVELTKLMSCANGPKTPKFLKQSLLHYIL